MRSIRVGGRTHCWVVDSLLREQEREHFRVWRGSHFCRARARIPRLQTSTEIEAARTTLKAGRTVRIEQAVQQEEQAQKSREGTVQQKRPYCTDFRISYSRKKGHENRGRKYSPYCTDFVQSVRLLFWHRFRGEGTVLFSGSFGTFPKAVVQHLLHCFGLRQLARISRHPYNILEAQKSRSRPAIYCRKFWKEF
jgi:hypothetical protein